MLQRALASRRMPHAYLFGGPDGVGKEMMALGLAQTLLCSNPVHREPPSDLALPAHGPQHFVDACGTCRDCLLAQASTHPDLILIHRQLNKQHPDAAIRKQQALFLTVDVVRHFLVERAGMMPARGRARVFIVREAERMNDAAQNSLLKTLEEPPKATFIILLTNAMDRMLQTTRSRCQQVLFGSLPLDYIVSRLRELRPDADEAHITYAARRCSGSLGNALRQIDDGLFEMKQAWGSRLIDLAQPPRGFAPHRLAEPFEADAKTLGKLVQERDPEVSDTDAVREGLVILVAVLGDFYIDALRRVTGPDLPPINADQPRVIEALTGLGLSGLNRALRELNQADTHLTRNANLTLTLESLFIRLARAREATILV